MSFVKKILTAACLMLFVYSLAAQTSLADAKLKNLRGVVASFSSVTQKDSIVLVCFWSINSDASIEELNAIGGHYEKWKQAIAFKMLAVCIDEGNSLSRIRSTVNGNGWPFDVYADINGDLHTALGAGSLPQALVLKDRQVVYQQSGFGAGSENYLFSKIQTLAGSRQKN
jgi:hypothetical protein